MANTATQSQVELFDVLHGFGGKRWTTTYQPVTEAYYTGTAYGVTDGYPEQISHCYSECNRVGMIGQQGQACTAPRGFSPADPAIFTNDCLLELKTGEHIAARSRISSSFSVPSLRETNTHDDGKAFHSIEDYVSFNVTLYC